MLKSYNSDLVLIFGYFKGLTRINFKRFLYIFFESAFCSDQEAIL